MKKKVFTKKNLGKFIQYRIVAVIIIAAINFLIFNSIVHSGFLYSWNFRLTDSLYTTENQASPDIIVVAIDEKSLLDKSEGGLGRWQEWTRDYYAQTLDHLVQAGASVVGVDVLFLDYSQNQQGDNQLSETIKKSDNIIIASKYDFDRSLYLKPRELFYGGDESKIAPINIPIDVDNIARRMFLYLSDGNTYHESFDVRLVKKFLGEPFDPDQKLPLENEQYAITQNRVRLPSDLNRSYPPITAPVVEGSSMYVNFFGPPFSFQKISLVDVYNNDFDPNLVKNKIILIGEMGATGLRDVQYTPVSRGIEMPGVEIHANTIQTMLTGKFLQTQDIKRQLISIGLINVFSAALFVIVPILASTLILILGTFFFVVSSILAFDRGILVNMFYIPLSYLLVYLMALIYKYFIESSKKRYLKSAFSHYVSGHLVEKIMKDHDLLQLGGARRELSILFSDIQGFTSLSEKMGPEELVSMLNEYLTQMTNIVFENKGTLDKYIGDAIMAFWGAPVDDQDHAYHACATALQMKKEMERIHERFLREKNIDLNIRIGINTGEVIVGNVGSNVRFDYTVIGDHVNLASRLEGANKQYHSWIMVSENTYQPVHDRFEFRELDIIQVKGKLKPIKVYELMAAKGKLPEMKQKALDLFHKGLSLYREQKWEVAIGVFKEVLAIEPNDGPSHTYIERCEYFKKDNPHHDWNGIFEMKTK